MPPHEVFGLAPPVATLAGPDRRVGGATGVLPKSTGSELALTARLDIAPIWPAAEPGEADQLIGRNAVVQEPGSSRVGELPLPMPPDLQTRSISADQQDRWETVRVGVARSERWAGQAIWRNSAAWSGARADSGSNPGSETDLSGEPPIQVRVVDTGPILAKTAGPSEAEDAPSPTPETYIALVGGQPVGPIPDDSALPDWRLWQASSNAQDRVDGETAVSIAPGLAPMQTPGSGMEQTAQAAPIDAGAKQSGESARTQAGAVTTAIQTGPVQTPDQKVRVLSDAPAKDVWPTRFGDSTPGRVEPTAAGQISQPPETAGVRPSIAGLAAFDRAEPQAGRFARHLDMPAVLPRNEAAGGGSDRLAQPNPPQTATPDPAPDRPGSVLARTPETTDAAMVARRETAPYPMTPTAAPVVPPADPGGDVDTPLAVGGQPRPEGQAQGADLDISASMPNLKSNKPLTDRGSAPVQPVPVRGADRPAPPSDSRAAEATAISAQDVSGLASGATEGLSRAAPTHAAMQPLANPPDLARGAAVQIAQIVHHAGNGTVELTLSPEDLGRVRISMSSEQGTLAVTLQADRPETLDMIRRHIDMFAEELRRLGHGSVGFSFQQGSAGFGGQQPNPETGRYAGDDPPGATDGPALPPRSLAAKPHAPVAGIDIRL